MTLSKIKNYSSCFDYRINFDLQISREAIGSNNQQKLSRYNTCLIYIKLKIEFLFSFSLKKEIKTILSLIPPRLVAKYYETIVQQYQFCGDKTKHGTFIRTPKYPIQSNDDPIFLYHPRAIAVHAL